VVSDPPQTAAMSRKNQRGDNRKRPPVVPSSLSLPTQCALPPYMTSASCRGLYAAGGGSIRSAAAFNEKSLLTYHGSRRKRRSDEPPIRLGLEQPSPSPGPRRQTGLEKKTSTEYWKTCLIKVAKAVQDLFGDDHWPTKMGLHNARETLEKEGGGWISVEALQKRPVLKGLKEDYVQFLKDDREGRPPDKTVSDRQFLKLIHKSVSSSTVVEASSCGNFIRRKVVNLKFLGELRHRIENLFRQMPLPHWLTCKMDPGGWVSLEQLMESYPELQRLRDQAEFEFGKFNFLDCLQFALRYSKLLMLNHKKNLIRRQSQRGLQILSERHFVFGESRVHRKGDIRLMTWNILADKHCEASIYPWCEPMYLEWARRRVEIMNNVQKYSPDILCFQEVQKDHAPWFCRYLDKLGYSGDYTARSPSDSDDELGLLCCWKESMFKLANESIHRIKFHDIADMCTKENRHKYEKSHKAVFIVLKAINSRIPDVPIVVANTHISANFKWPELQISQTAYMMQELSKTIKTEREANPRRLEPVVLVGGDFNSTPGSDALKLLCEGTTGKTFPGEPFPDPTNDVPLQSAYASAMNEDPAFTAFTLDRLFPDENQLKGFKGTLDYILYNNIRPISVLEPITEQESNVESAWPSQTQPSDHMHLVADFDMLLPPM